MRAAKLGRPSPPAPHGAAMKLLVTGGAGYVGSVCAAHLLESGHDVVVLDDLSTGHRDAVPDGCRFVRGDVAAAAAATLAEGGFYGVLHFSPRSRSPSAWCR